MQGSHIKKRKTPTKQETSFSPSQEKPTKVGHQEHKSSLLKTLFSTEIDSKNIAKEGKVIRKCPKAPRDPWRPWREDEHVQLVELIRKKGPQWEQLSSYFPNRQREEIKRHCLTRLKNVIEQMISSRKRKGEFNLKAMFRDLRGLMEDIRQGKVSEEARVEETKELIATMLLYHHNKNQDELRPQRQELRELNHLLRDFRKITKKRGSQASTSGVLSKSQNSSEKGYSSDCSSIFSESILEKPITEIIKPAIEEEEEPSSDENKGNLKKAIILDKQCQIRDLLLNEGLLQMEVLGEKSQRLSGLVCFSGDELQNESYQHFCNIGQTQMRRRSQRLAARGKSHTKNKNNNEAP